MGVATYGWGNTRSSLNLFLGDEVVPMYQQNELVLAQLSDEILSYLQAHPQAADTVDGIVEWWLPRQRHDVAVDQVQHALDELVASGLVDQIMLVEGTVLYADRTQRSAFLQ